MKKLLLIIFTSMLIPASIARSDFRPGYVILNAQDTIHRLVDYREGGRKYHLCEFKISDGAAVTSYTPADIAGYHFVNDKFLVSKKHKKSRGYRRETNRRSDRERRASVAARRASFCFTFQTSPGIKFQS